MRLLLEVSGPWRDVVEAAKAEMKTASMADMRARTDAAKGALRAQLARAFPGTRAPYLVGSHVYPEQRVSLDPLGLIHPRGVKAAAAIAAFEAGGVVRSPAGLWLALPTAAVPRGGGNRQTRLRPEEVEARFGRRLRLVTPGGGRVAFLVLPPAPGTRGPATRMFVLVPQATLPKRLDFDAAAGAAGGVRSG